MRRRGDHVVAVYPYEKGTGFEGGYLEGLLTLLRETRQAGIACRNIHPDNLLVTSSGLKLIDYGSDIVPVSADESKQMYRRVFLTYRFPFRSDLKRLMTKALTDASLPELTGLDLFLRALNPRGLDELYYRPMADLVSSEGPGAVLDYGCGGGRLTEELSRQGIRAIGYDPDPVSIALRLKHGNLATYGGRELLAGISHIGSLQPQRAAQTRWEHHSQVLQGQSIAGLSNKGCVCSRRAPFLSVFIVLVSPASGVKPH